MQMSIFYIENYPKAMQKCLTNKYVSRLTLTNHGDCTTVCGCKTAVNESSAAREPHKVRHLATPALTSRPTIGKPIGYCSGTAAATESNLQHTLHRQQIFLNRLMKNKSASLV